MYKNLVGFSAIALLCTKAMAQQGLHSDDGQETRDSIQLQELDEVVVSDTRFSLKRENSGKTVIKIPEEELERNQGRTVAEIINTKSGLELNGSRSFSGQNISVFARGGNNRQVLVIIDGIQVSDPSNVNSEYDLRMLNVAQIESIEIIKGASSTLYGNSAATAVINITTKEAKVNGLELEVVSNWGTNQSQNQRSFTVSDISNNITIKGKQDGFTLLASGGNHFTDGLSAAIGKESDVFSRINGNFKLGYELSQKFKMEVSAFYNKLDSDYDNGFPIEDADFHFNSEQSRFGLANTYRYKNGTFHVNAAFNQISRTFESDFPSFYDSETLVLDVFNKYTFNNTLYTIIGLNLVDNRTVFSGQQETRNIDPYFNLVYVSDFGVNINAGARWNNHSEYGSHWIYSFNPSYRLKTKNGYLKVFGAHATSYIAPNLSQLYGPFGANAGLNPEENITLEGGLEYQMSKGIRFSTVYFNRKEEDRIEYVVINPDTFESQYQNSNEHIQLSGIEVELQAIVLNGLQLTTNYTYIDSETDLALRIPKHKWNARIAYTWSEKTYASVSYQRLSERLDTDFNTFSDVTLQPYDLINAYVKHQWNDQLSFMVSMENIFNENYVEILNYTTKGRNYRIGMTLRL